MIVITSKGTARMINRVNTVKQTVFGQHPTRLKIIDSTAQAVPEQGFTEFTARHHADGEYVYNSDGWRQIFYLCGQYKFCVMLRRFFASNDGIFSGN